MNLLLFNIRTDLADPTFGFTTTWINALAQRCKRVVVVTMQTGLVEVESNVEVHALSSVTGTSRPRKVARFYRAVLRALSSQPIDACFAHMTPHLASLFWPVARLYRIPVVLWYAHGSVPLSLRIAHPLVDRCLTSTRDGFRLKSNKLSVVGQGIDTKLFFPPTSHSPGYDRTAVSVGRITPRKRLEEIIEAIGLSRRAGVDVRLLIVGGPVTDSDRLYEAELKALARSLDIDDAVAFRGAVPFPRVPETYRRAGLFVNVSETESLDKAILESMASGSIPVSRNRSFAAIARDEDLDFLVPPQGAKGVADCLRDLLARPKVEHDVLRQRLRAIVREDHSLDSLMDEVRKHLEQLAFGQSLRDTSKPE